MKVCGLALILITACAASHAAAQARPDTENGRYALSPIADGVVRLDTRNGTVSTCRNDGQGWACFTTPDERVAFDAEIGRLQAENERLRAQLSRPGDTAEGKIDEALPKSDPLVPSLPRSADGERRLEIPLPSDRDVNRFVGFLEDAWRKLVAMASRMQRDADGKI